MAADEKTNANEIETARSGDAALETLGISRRRLAYVAPMILLSRKMIYRAAGCGKERPSERQCHSLRGS